jgi:hypothetical protein
LLNRF